MHSVPPRCKNSKSTNGITPHSRDQTFWLLMFRLSVWRGYHLLSFLSMIPIMMVFSFAAAVLSRLAPNLLEDIFSRYY
ncbi:hypothetical protein KCP77_03155 [Salmonella enterica subsp. enterica]|nr:hypothetical protein KCP77_03155 [Salmonella enterica subsp. enterica]